MPSWLALSSAIGRKKRQHLTQSVNSPVVSGISHLASSVAAPGNRNVASADVAGEVHAMLILERVSWFCPKCRVCVFVVRVGPVLYCTV